MWVLKLIETKIYLDNPHYLIHSIGVTNLPNISKVLLKSFPTLPLRINTQLYQIWLYLDSQHDSFDQLIFQNTLFSYQSNMTIPCLVVLSHSDATPAWRLVGYESIFFYLLWEFNIDDEYSYIGKILGNDKNILASTTNTCVVDQFSAVLQFGKLWKIK